MLEQGIYELLTTEPAVEALINDVYWILAPKNQPLPYIVASRVLTEDTYTMEGATPLRGCLFQMDCYATDYYTARAISTAVRKLLESYTGNLPDVDSTPVTAVFTEKDWDMPYEEGAKGFVYRALLQFRIWTYDTAFTVSTGEGLFWGQF